MKKTLIMLLLIAIAIPLFAGGNKEKSANSSAMMSTSAEDFKDLTGVRFVVTNTFQGYMTKDIETDVAVFGLDNNKFATVGPDVELPSFINIYDIDVSGDMIKFTWRETVFSKEIAGPMDEGSHDRNYFLFDIPEGIAIDTVTYDEANSELLSGSAIPTATVISSNRILLENSVGFIHGVGSNPAFKITFKKQ